jgi:acyl carrier protein
VDGLDKNLMRCFSAAFPGASPEEILAAKTFDSIPGSDSLRIVNFLAILDDELGVQMDLEELLDQAPFSSVKLEMIRQATKAVPST